MYKEIKPSKAIDHVIDTFWTFSENKSSESFKVLPDTCTDLIFDLKHNKGFLSGAMTQYQSPELMKDSELIGIRFKIEKFSSLSKTPLHYTKNLRVELNETFSSKYLEPLNRPGDFEKLNHKIKFLENFKFGAVPVLGFAVGRNSAGTPPNLKYSRNLILKFFLASDLIFGISKISLFIPGRKSYKSF